LNTFSLQIVSGFGNKKNEQTQEGNIGNLCFI